MEETPNRPYEFNGFKWDRLNRFLAITLIVLGFVVSLSLLDYSRATITRTSKVGTQAITSDAPLTAFHLITSYTIAYLDWVQGHAQYEDVKLASDLLEYRFTADYNFGEPIKTFVDSDFKTALNHLLLVQNKYGSKNLSSAEQRLIYTEVKDDISVLEESGFVMTRNYFRSIVDTFQDGANIQSDRARRTLALFIGFFIILITFAVRIIKDQYEAIQNEHVREAGSTKLVQTMEAQLLEARASVSEINKSAVGNNDYLSTVNHELRTPLTSIIGYIDMLKDIKTIDQDYELSLYLGVLDRNASVLLDIIEDILVMPKYESGNLNTDFTKIDLVQAVKEQETELSLGLHEKRITLRVNSAEDSFFVSADDVQIRQVLRNLISNAIKYSPKDTEISVDFSRSTLESEHQYIAIAIKDEGIGIPAADVDKVFEKFYRASNAESRGAKGTGLGLSIVQNILVRFGGDVYVESIEGIGSTFTVVIPEYLDATQRMIMENRAGVLERAIEGIALSRTDNLQANCHQFGGAIGFYNFGEESEHLLEFSRWLKSNLNGNAEIVAGKKEQLLIELRNSLSRIQPSKEI
jgi:signal transduction histidine kinase